MSVDMHSFTATEIAEAITHLAHTASREFPVVGTEAAPTPWDRRHAEINARLVEWEAARA